MTRITMMVALCLGIVCAGFSAPQYDGSPKINDTHRFLQESSEPRFTDQQPSSLDDIVIPRKTKIFFTLQQTISTKAAGTGDKFFGKIAVPVTVNDQIVIPVGSYIIGHILAAD